jgi:lipid-A-disaccharide synthase
MNRSPDHPISRPLQFLLSAGEASGDTYGAQLAEALRRLLSPSPDGQSLRVPGDPASGAQFFGMGGEKMRAAGCELLVHANEVAVVGLVEVLKHLPDIRRRFRHLVAEAARRRPDAAVLIDFPDFNLRLARELHGLGIPVFYFVSPQIWAWRAGRVRQIQKYVRKMIVIFPFEREFYRGRGVEVSYVGHPLAYAAQPRITREEFAAQHGLGSGKPWIALLPGSRRKEFRLNLPPMLRAAGLLRQQGYDCEFLLPVASTLSPRWVCDQLPAEVKPESGTTLQPPLKGRSSAGLSSAGGGSFTIHLTENARATLMHSRAAVVASGTATVEAALSGTPFVVVYRLAPLTWLLGRRLVRLDTFAMPNLIAGKRVVPELIQGNFTAENVLRELTAVISDGPARQTMQDALKMVQERLRDRADGDSPATKAAREILAALLTSRG